MASKAAQALLARIVEITSEHADERSYIATSRLSTPVLSEHVAVLSQPDGAFVSDEALAAAVELSKMVDCVQDGSLSYNHPASVGVSYVTDVYKEAVEDIEFARTPLTADQKADRDRAVAILYVDAPFVRTENYNEFLELRAEVAALEIGRSEARRDLQQADEAEKESAEDRLEAIEAELNANQTLLEALDAQHGFSMAEDLYNGAAVAGFPPKFERAHDFLDDPAFEITNPFSNETHWPASFFPNQLAEENWVPIKISRADIANAGASGGAKMPDLPQAAQQLALNDEALDLVELEVQVLRVDRPWMWGGIFENKQWRFQPGVEPLSNGKPDAIGQLPAFVTGLIFGRNLRLSGRKNMVSGGTLKLGLLKFKPITSVTALQLSTARVTPFTATMIATQPVAAAAPAVPPQLETSPVARANFSRLNLPLASVVAVQRIGVKGQTVDSNNKPLAGVNVMLANRKNGAKLKGVSDKNGNVLFRLNAEGAFDVAASKKGFKDFTTRVNLKNGGTFRAKLEPHFVFNMTAATVFKPTTAATLKPTTAATLNPDLAASVFATVTLLGNTVTVKLRKRGEDNSIKPLDVPVEVVAINLRTKKRHHQTVAAGKDALFTNLDKEKYNINVHCAVYEPEGQTSKTVDASGAKTLEFNFRPRTILQSNDTFLFGFLCYRTPTAPNPDKNVNFGD